MGGLRENYRHELLELERELLALGRLVDTAVQRALWALRQGALREAEAIIRDDDLIDSTTRDLSEHAMRIIATQGPVAGDLRLVGAFIQSATELERIGDYAEGIAKIITRFGERPAGALSPEIELMAADARAMLAQALNALTARDADLNLRLKQQDDKVDACYDRLFGEVTALMQSDPTMVVPGTYQLWVGHNLERIADRAVNIAEHVEFIVRGKVSQRDQA